MKNLKHYNNSSLDFFDEIIKSKKNSPKDPSYKDRVKLLRPTISTKMDEYDAAFNTNSLTSLIQFGYDNQNKTDLLKLYSYRNSRIKKLKSIVTTNEYNRIINTCQNCTINEVNSLDHFVPKDEFPEFSIHPKNLFPSCTTCNGHKNINWRNGTQPIFLNLYLDILPDIQYLFVNLNISSNSIIANFSINNINHIDSNLYLLIENHYIKLNLLNRFKENCHDTIVNLKHTIIAEKNHLSKQQIISITEDRVSKERVSFGFNYWKSILVLALINNNDFMDPLFR